MFQPLFIPKEATNESHFKCPKRNTDDLFCLVDGWWGEVSQNTEFRPRQCVSSLSAFRILWRLILLLEHLMLKNAFYFILDWIPQSVIWDTTLIPHALTKLYPSTMQKKPPKMPLSPSWRTSCRRAWSWSGVRLRRPPAPPWCTSCCCRWRERGPGCQGASGSSVRVICSYDSSYFSN